MTSNLRPYHANHFYRVRKGFPVYVLIGHRKSNCSYGSSMLYGAVYQRTQLKPGDQLHALVGGDFLVKKDGRAYPVRLRLSEKSPFEKSYGEPRDLWPLDSLVELRGQTAGQILVLVHGYPYEFPVIEDGAYPGTFVGRGIDRVLTEVLR